MERKENGTTSDEGRSTVSLENEEHSDEGNIAGPSGTISAFAQIMLGKQNALLEATVLEQDLWQYPMAWAASW